MNGNHKPLTKDTVYNWFSKYESAQEQQADSAHFPVQKTIRSRPVFSESLAEQSIPNANAANSNDFVNPFDRDTLMSKN